MTDFFIAEEIYKMIKSIPKPRLLFKKGITVKGYFHPYMSLQDYTTAKIFRDPDEITPVTVRFSSMLGDKGTADTRRNVKNMSVKFHSYNDTYDVICQNIPVTMSYSIKCLTEIVDIYNIRDYFDGINRDKFWKFVSEHKESILYALILYSHTGISDSFINIKQFSVNRYFWRNSNNVLSLVRYKWLPKTRKTKEQVCDDRLVSVNAAEFIAGYDPDRAIDEMISCINNNKYPAFELYIQMVSGSKICNRKYRDNTLLWDEKEAPYMRAGIMVLDQIDMNMTDDPKIYYLPSNTVDGIELCEDKISHTIDFVIKTEAIERGGYL